MEILTMKSGFDFKRSYCINVFLSLILIEHIEAHGQGDIDVELLIAHLFTEQKLFDLADSITDGVVMTLE